MVSFGGLPVLLGGARIVIVLIGMAGRLCVLTCFWAKLVVLTVIIVVVRDRLIMLGIGRVLIMCKTQDRIVTVFLALCVDIIIGRLLRPVSTGD